MASVASMRGAHRVPAQRRDVLLAAGLALAMSAFVVLVKRLVEAVAALASAGVDASVHELALSRARIQATADDERRRIERDLHDGVQQRLVALRVRLALAADQIRAEPAHGPRLLEEIGAQLEDAFEEVRTLAHDVYPPELVEFGLEAALRDLAVREPIPTTVSTDGLGRLPPDIEATVYFCCAAAARNAVERARGADRIAIAITVEGESLRFEVSDNGHGVSEYSASLAAGFVMMRDRLGAVAGQLDISSGADGGTRVVGTMPLAQEHVVLSEAEDRERVLGR